jgi:hypothetical protein
MLPASGIVCFAMLASSVVPPCREACTILADIPVQFAVPGVVNACSVSCTSCLTKKPIEHFTRSIDTKGRSSFASAPT